MVGCVMVGCVMGGCVCWWGVCVMVGCTCVVLMYVSACMSCKQTILWDETGNPTHKKPHAHYLNVHGSPLFPRTGVFNLHSQSYFIECHVTVVLEQLQYTHNVPAILLGILLCGLVCVCGWVRLHDKHKPIQHVPLL